MKLLFSVLLFVLTNTLRDVQIPDQNFLINGDFEQSKNGILPDYWNGDSKFYSWSSIAATGRHSLEYSNSDSSVYKLCLQTLNIKPGKNYTAGIKIKTVDISGNDYGASFCVEWLDGNGKYLGGAHPKGIKGTKDWTEITSILSIPENAEKIYYYCYVRRGMTGTAWFDDAYIKPYMYNKFKVIMLQPDYRGLIFNNENQKITLSVSLDSVSNKGGYLLLTRIDDSSGVELVSDTSVIDTSRLNYKIRLDAADLRESIYTLSVKLIDKNGTTEDFWHHTIKKVSEENRPDVYFDSNKKLVVNGKKIFPLGMYWKIINEADLKIYKESNFNFILPYSPPTRVQMKLANKYNIKVIYSVKDYYAGTQYAPAAIKSTSDEIPLLKGTVEQFKKDSSLLAWYNNDEYPPDYMNRLNEHYRLISSEDPDHPVLSIILNPVLADLYLNSTDIIGSDPYVVPKLPLYGVADATQTIANKTENSHPIWMVIQTHNIGNYKEFVTNPEDYRAPTYDEMRSMSWQAICSGANGLLYYSFFDLKRNPDVPFETQWTNLKKIAAEIHSYSDILLSDEQSNGILISTDNGDNSWLNWITRKYNNKLYIFIIDNGKNEGKITVRLYGNYKTVSRANGHHEHLLLNNSQFTDIVGKLELKIYRIR